MSEVPRVSPSGGSEGARKDRTSVDDDKFKKMMRVEQVNEIDPHEKRNRKRREESAEEADEEVKKADSSHVKKNVKSLETESGGPLDRKKVSPKSPLSSSPSSSSEKARPMADFNPEEIENYAWEEDAESPSTQITAKNPSTTPPTTNPISETAVSKSLKGQPAPEHTVSKSPEPESTQSTPSAPIAPKQPLFAAEAGIIKDEVPKEESPQPYPEEWPHTTSYRPTPAFRSEDIPRPSKDEPLSPSRKVPADDEHEVEKRKTQEAEPANKKSPDSSQKKSLPPGLPKGKKEKEVSFAELMEEDGDKKAKGPTEKKGPTPPSSQAQQKEGAPLIPKNLVEGGSKETPPSPPDTSKTTGLTPTVPPATSSPKESFAFLKKTEGTTISPQKDKEEGKEEIPLVGAGSSSKQDSMGEGEEKEDHEGKGASQEAAAIAAASGATAEATPFLPHVEGAQPTPPTPYVQMSPQIMALYERMVGVMTIIQTTGVTETVLTLNARQFATSVLYGSQLVIREYSTAPTAFNVEFIGSSDALKLVQQNIPGLMGAVQQGNFNFSINRFDVKLSSTEKPIFSRKETSQDKESDSDKEKEKGT